VEHAIYGTLMNRNTNVGPHTVLAVLQLDSTSMVAFVVVKALSMQEKHDLFIRGLLQGVLLELQHPLYLVDRMLMKTTTFLREGL
jgi:hypothetical protein